MYGWIQPQATKHIISSIYCQNRRVSEHWQIWFIVAGDWNSTKCFAACYNELYCWNYWSEAYFKLLCMWWLWKEGGIILIKIKWFENLAAFLVLCFCSLFPYWNMTLTLHRLQKVLRCKWANGKWPNEQSHQQQKIITVTLHTTWNKAAL